MAVLCPSSHCRLGKLLAAHRITALVAQLASAALAMVALSVE